MTDAQAWTTIAGLIGAFFTFTALMMRLFGTTLDAKLDKFDAMDAKVTYGFQQVDARFEQVDVRFAHAERRLDRLDTRVDNLDRDVTAITRRLFGTGE